MNASVDDGASMYFLFAWLALSIVCTGIVLLCIRFAPVIEDPPLDRFDGLAKEAACDLEQFGGVQQPTAAVADPQDATPGRAKTVPIASMKRVPLRKHAASSSTRRPKLSHYLIIRSEEAQG